MYPQAQSVANGVNKKTSHNHYARHYQKKSQLRRLTNKLPIKLNAYRLLSKFETSTHKYFFLQFILNRHVKNLQVVNAFQFLFNQNILCYYNHATMPPFFPFGFAEGGESGAVTDFSIWSRCRCLNRWQLHL